LLEPTANQRARHSRPYLFSINSLKRRLVSRDEVPHLPESITRDFPCPLMMLTRLAVGLEPLNALDAAHRSPRSGSLSRAQNLVPPLDRLLADPLSETKN
jgi:hypothetical protein